jgi:hypothetical protein
MGHGRLRIGVGIALCMSGLIFIDNNRWLLGLACFAGGFLLLMINRFER